MATSARITLALAAVVFVLLPISASPQAQTTGRIAGRVTDAQGAVVAGATVTLSDSATADTRNSATDVLGNYSIALLPPGVYQLSVSARGFATARFTRIRIGTNQPTSVNVSLSVASASAEVIVNDTPPLIQFDGAQLSTILDVRSLSDLPSPTRNFLQLATIAPGVSAVLTNNSSIGRNSPNFSVNGARSEQNNLQINGVNANDMYGHDFDAVSVPAPESIQEVAVLTSMFDASHKGAGGANVEVVTKSGSNLFHGNIYEYFRNNVMNANDPSLKQAGVHRPVLQQNVYGATVGGPIRKNRAFYFFSYQGTRQKNGATDESIYKNVLIAPGLSDDRSEATLLRTFRPRLIDGTPATSINPISLALLNYKLPNGQFLIPTPQQADGRVSGTSTSRYHEEQFNANLDFRLGPNDTIAEKFFFSNGPLFNARGGDLLGGSAFGNRTLPGFGLNLENHNRIVSISHAHAFGTRAVNEARIGYNFILNRALPQESLLDSNVGIQRPTAHDFPGLPTILLARDAGGASIGSTFITLNNETNYSWSISDTVSVHRGKHDIRFGGDFGHYWWNAHVNANTYGEIDFSTFNDFLVGNSDLSLLGVGLSHRHFRTSDYNAFVQDDWKVSHNLTLNVGVRYELNLPPYETHGLIGGFDPSLYESRMEVGPEGLPVGPPAAGIVMADNSSYQLPGVQRVGKRVVNSLSARNFGPRIGFAWSPLDSGRVVLRGGYGIFYSEPSFFYLAWDYFSPPFYQNFVSTAHTFAKPFPDIPAESSFPLIAKGYTLATNPMDPNLRTPHFEQFNTSVQFELFRETLLQVAYAGTRGSRLFRQKNINQAQIASLNHPIVNQVTGEVITTNTVENAPLRAPMQGVDTAFFNLNQSNASSTYHSLQTTLNRRLSRGMEFQASYTFSKSIDDTSFPGLDTGGLLGNQVAANSNRGISDFDRPHRFVGYFLWDLPCPVSDSSSLAVRHLLSHWQISGIVTVMSGLPIDIFDPGGASLYGLAGARPNWAPGANRQTALSNIPPGYYFNPFAFAEATVQPGQPIPSANGLAALAGDAGTDFGNVGRNILRGPSQANVDLSVSKRFTIRESKTLEFHADFFNLFNHANRENPVADISAVSGTGGSIDSKTGRIISPGDFGKIVSFSSSPRMVQLSLRFAF